MKRHLWRIWKGICENYEKAFVKIMKKAFLKIMKRHLWKLWKSSCKDHEKHDNEKAFMIMKRHLWKWRKSICKDYESYEKAFVKIMTSVPNVYEKAFVKALHCIALPCIALHCIAWDGKTYKNTTDVNSRQKKRAQ